MNLRDNGGAGKFDVVVIGGGPSGSTAATLLAQAGLRVALVERERMPRFHIGESLMPQTYWVFQRLGILRKLKGSLFPRKYSVQFINEQGKESVPFYFFETNPHESAVTWQVWRADFDRMLLDHARESGAQVYEGWNVVDIYWDGERAVGVRARPWGLDGDASAESREFFAEVLVDASGQSALVARKLNVRRHDPYLRKAAVWTYYRGAYRDPGIDEGATLVLHTKEKKGWFWYIPLPENVVSVGVVADAAYLLRGRGTPEQIFHEEVARCPALERRLAPGQQFGPYYVTKEFSYTTTRAVGPGWILVGDALTFLDPIYSSGVFLALKSGELAAEAILSCFRTGDFSEERLGGWIAPFRRGVQAIKRLVLAFYTPEFSFGEFVRRFPDQRQRLIDLLVGDVFKDDVYRLFDDLQKVVNLPE